MHSVDSLSPFIVSFAIRYWLHSSIFLLSCWLLLRFVRSPNPAIVEQSWKLAAVLGLLTASLQPLVGQHLISELAWTTRGNSNWARLHPPEPRNISPSRSGKVPFDRLSETAARANSLASAATASDANIAVSRSRSAPEAPVIHIDARKNRRPAPPQLTPIRSNRNIAIEGKATGASNRWNVNIPLFSLPQMRWQIQATSLAVLGLLLGGLVVSIWRLVLLQARIARTDPIHDGPAHDALLRLLARLKIDRAIRLKASEEQTDPIACGLFRWTIVLPKYVNQEMASDELEALLAHELAHLRRGDIVWLWIGNLQCTCLAFQPLNFLARRRWQHAAEHLCDEWAVSRGVQPLSLARCLMHVAEQNLTRAHGSFEVAVAGDSSSLVGRVQNLVESDPPANRSKQPLWRIGTYGIGLLLGGAVLMLAPRIALADEGTAIESISTEQVRKTKTKTKTPDEVSDHVATPPQPASPVFDTAEIELDHEIHQLVDELERAKQLTARRPNDRRAQAAMQSISDRAKELRTNWEATKSSLRKDSNR